MLSSSDQQSRVAQYVLEITIAAPPTRVWRAITSELHDWWLPDFHVLGRDSTITLDAVAGGLMIERTKVASLLWFTVQDVTEYQSITLAGYCTPKWGGPCTTIVTFDLESAEDSTVVKLSDALFGHVSEKQVVSLSTGWMRLLKEGLKPFAEK